MLNSQILCVDSSIWENKKNLCFYLQNLCVNHSALSFLSFLCDNLLLQKCSQSLCEMTVFLCVNLIDPSNEWERGEKVQARVDAAGHAPGRKGQARVNSAGRHEPAVPDDGRSWPQVFPVQHQQHDDPSPFGLGFRPGGHVRPGRTARHLGQSIHRWRPVAGQNAARSA